MLRHKPRRVGDPRERGKVFERGGQVLLNWWDNIPYVDLTNVTIPQSVIDLLPESVARENTVLLLAHEDRGIKLVIADPTDLDTIQKLQFILNKDVYPVLSSREQIVEAINRHYGR
jgi:type IV pilus assembly protein PilB